ncbi:MAG: serine/threonine-protein phosphatase [Planctomycetia bacterium]|nr:serine/threonine-protein phosphatase [Planctomycetia bacterium]
MPATIAAAEHMVCMEVWGGNQAAESGVVMAGLDAWVYSRPYQGAAGGGDVHYVSSCATGRINRLLVADVSGHGAKVADTAAVLRTLMRRYVNHISQGKFVARMNEHFGTLAESGVFATAAVATFFAPTNYLSFSNAGHPSPLLYRAKRKAWSLLDEALERPAGDDDKELIDMPLGMVEASRYDERHARLRVGDLLLFYTDSLIESRRQDGELLGIPGLLDIVRRLDPADPAAFVPALLETIAKEHEDNLTEDDVTVMLFRPNGLAPRVPLKDRLAAPFRFLKGLFRGLARRGQVVPWPEFSLANLGGAMFDPLSRLWGGGKENTDEEAKENGGTRK